MFKIFVSLVVVTLVLVSSYAAEYPKVNIEVYYESLCPLVPYGNTKKNADGSFTCQHGTDECISDAYELCTEYHLSGNLSSISTGDTSYQAWPFVQCLELNEGDPTKAQSCFTSTIAKTTTLTWNDITDCYNNEFLDVQNEGAKATPSHDYVPWVLVDGTLLENTNLLLPTICKAYTGPAPASCSRFLKKTADVCYNK
eukprot:gene9517-10333_t